MTEETQSLNAAFVEEGAFSVSFFQKRKHHKYREVAAPVLPGLVADTHAHLEMLKNPAAELAKCAYHNVRFVCAMCDPAEDSHTTFDNLEAWQQDAQGILEEAGLGSCKDAIPHLRIAMGVHPHNAKMWDVRMERTLMRRLADPRVCALGEVGLDYHYDLSPRAVQRGVFRRQVQLAKTAGLPLILHMREAHEEGLAILEDEGFPRMGYCCIALIWTLKRLLHGRSTVATLRMAVLSLSKRPTRCDLPQPRLLVTFSSPKPTVLI